MSGNGNAIDRAEAISYLQKADDCCATANEMIIAFSNGLTGLAQSIVGEPGSELIKHYNNMRYAAKEANTTMLEVKETNISFANLINTSSSKVAGGAPAVFKSGNYRSIPDYDMSALADKKAGVKDPTRALEIMDNDKKSITSLQTNLSNAIKDYKAIWAIADEANKVRGQAHALANGIRVAMNSFSEALTAFSSYLNKFMEESLSDSERNGNITGEQVLQFTTKLSSFQSQVRALPAAWGDHYIDEYPNEE